MLESSSWSDALVAFAHLPGTEHRLHGPSPTHFPTHGSWVTRSGGSRIDHILVNHAAKRLAVDAWTSPKRIPGGHLPLFIQLDVSAISAKAWFWNRPQPFEVPPYPKLADSVFLAKENEARAAANSDNEELAFQKCYPWA